MENVHESTEEDFQRLRPQIHKYRTIYNNFYKPLRHKLFAHRDKEFHDKSSDLWEATKGADMEEMLNFLEDFDFAIKEAYLNGRNLNS